MWLSLADLSILESVRTKACDKITDAETCKTKYERSGKTDTYLQCVPSPATPGDKSSAISCGFEACQRWMLCTKIVRTEKNETNQSLSTLDPCCFEYCCRIATVESKLMFQSWMVRIVRRSRFRCRRWRHQLLGQGALHSEVAKGRGKLWNLHVVTLVTFLWQVIASKLATTACQIANMHKMHKDTERYFPGSVAQGHGSIPDEHQLITFRCASEEWRTGSSQKGVPGNLLQIASPSWIGQVCLFLWRKSRNLAPIFWISWKN